MDEAILVSIMGLLALSTMVTPAAIFIENGQCLGHPSKLMALSLHFFCAYSAHCVCELYLGRCPRLYTAALSVRAACGGAGIGAVIFIP